MSKLDFVSGTGEDLEVDRRHLLKMAGAAVMAAPGISTLEGLFLEGSAEAAPAVREGRNADAVAPQVLLGGAPVRPPSIPLAVRSPYLSTWLPATRLTGETPQFWTGAARGFTGLVRIDGQTHVWAGRPELLGIEALAMRQLAVEVTATRSIFTFAAGGVSLTAQWLSPIEPGSLQLQSAPLCLLNVSVDSIDGAEHAVQLYVDVTGEWTAGEQSDLIEWDTVTWNKPNGFVSRAWVVQLQDPQPVTESQQMAAWGNLVWSTRDTQSLSYQSGAAVAPRTLFAVNGKLPNTSDPQFRAVDDGQPTFAFVHDLGTVRSGSVDFAIGHLRTPLVSYGPDAKPLLPLWTEYWSSWETMVGDFLADAGGALARAAELDLRIAEAATETAGPGYSAICALALRQCYGGTELAIGPQGTPWLLGKEISSDGCVNTVDIFDQAFLAWLWLDPDRIPLVMEPILDWCSSDPWQDDSAWTGIPSWEESQTKYCAHDVGVYPVASGELPGAGEQMPIEESAGMLIMAAAYARKVGASAAKPFLTQWQAQWTQWAQYLLTQVPTPAAQLTTDDWVPAYTVPSGSVNLGIKAIIGLAAASQIATVLEDHANASAWAAAASDNVEPWVSLSTDSSGDYLNLEQGASGTWSTLYNAYYEKVLGLQLVPDDVAARQADFYLNQLTTFGMPLQTGANDMNKVAWLVYISAWLDGFQIRDELLTRQVAYIQNTPSLVPYGDRYNTVTGVEAAGIRAHPTLGAVFALLACEI